MKEWQYRRRTFGRGRVLEFFVRDERLVDPLLRWCAEGRRGTSAVVRRNAEVYQFQPEHCDRELFVKRYTSRKFGDFLIQTCTHTRAERALRGAIALKKHGFRTPEVVAIVIERRFGFVTGNILCTEMHGSALSLRAALCRTQEASKRETLVDSLAALVAELHARGLSHGDLQTDNLLLEEGTYSFLDNERTAVLRPLPVFARIRNLRQLISYHSALTASEREQVLERYLEYSRLTASAGAALRTYCLFSRRRRRFGLLYLPDMLSIYKAFWRLRHVGGLVGLRKISSSH